jgi:hypothetical protein
MSDVSDMGETVKEKLKAYGHGVKIYPLATMIKPEVIDINDYSMIDDFTFIYGGNGVRIGSYVNIISFVSVIGGVELFVGDYADIACGSRTLTGTDTYKEG